MSDRTGAILSEQTFGETVAGSYGVPFVLAADGKWYRADASDPLLSRGDMALCVETSVSADGEGALLKYGWIQRTGWTWTLGQPVYFGATPGTLTQTKPVGNTIRYAGYPVAADALWFSPTDPVLAEFFSLELPDGVQGDILYHSGLGWVPLNAGAAGQVLATGGPGANPTWSSASGLPSGTQGDILYHNGAAWIVLNPGTAGQVLQTGGTGADPTWASAGGGLPAGIDGDVPYHDGTGWGVENTGPLTSPKRTLVLQGASLIVPGTDGAEIVTETLAGGRLIRGASFGVSASDITAQIGHPMPTNWDGGTVTAQFLFATVATAGTVIFSMAGRASVSDNGLDQAFGTAQSATLDIAAQPGKAAWDLWTTGPTNPITLAGSPQGAGRRWVQWVITRDAADTCAEDVLLLAVVIEYGTDGYSDA